MPKKYDKRKFRNAKEASVFETVEYQIKKGKLKFSFFNLIFYSFKN